MTITESSIQDNATFVAAKGHELLGFYTLILRQDTGFNLSRVWRVRFAILEGVNVLFFIVEKHEISYPPHPFLENHRTLKIPRFPTLGFYFASSQLFPIPTSASSGTASL
jgi:hypothetical protein